ncbi:MAG: hypothetical protein ACE5LU_15340 [Anaerolineae bacterium]
MSEATPWWVDFLGQQSTISIRLRLLDASLDGQPLPVGAVVRAYDPPGCWPAGLR